MKALQTSTDQLPSVQIVKPEEIVGRDSITSIQAGLYYGQLGAIKELISGITKEVFKNDKPITIGTGGFSQLIENEKVLNLVMPDLVLEGIRLALLMNIK